MSALIHIFNKFHLTSFFCFHLEISLILTLNRVMLVLEGNSGFFLIIIFYNFFVIYFLFNMSLLFNSCYFSCFSLKVNLWQYGDFTDDDAPEFGYR